MVTFWVTLKSEGPRRVEGAKKRRLGIELTKESLAIDPSPPSIALLQV